MMTREKKEAIVTAWLNVYVSEELNRTNKYIEEEVCNKLDTIMKKGKLMYVNYQQEGETGLVAMNNKQTAAKTAPTMLKVNIMPKQ